MKTMRPSKIIIDCDPGADDAIALMLACASPELSIMGVLAAIGNAPSALTARNACQILSLCGRKDIPVFRGADNFLRGNFTFDDAYCGWDGLCETGLFRQKEIPCAENGIAWLIQTLLDAKEPIKILSIAPMTNLATAIEQRPEIINKIDRIITTSGYYGVCPSEKLQAPRREWNIAVDPYAAKVVFDTSVPIYALGLDVTVQLDNTFANRILKDTGQGAKSEFLRRATEFYLTKGLEPYSLFVDAMAVAYAIRPEIAEFTPGVISLQPECQTEDFMSLHPADGRTASAYASHSFSFAQYETLLRERIFHDEISHVK